MSYFVLIYYGLLIAASCVAAHYKMRAPFMMLFLLTIASAFFGLLGGEDWLWGITV